MFEQTYLDLLSIFETITEFRHIDLYADQYRVPQKELEFPLPAILIEFSALNTEELGDNVQEGEGEIVLHILSDVNLTEVSNSTAPSIRSAGLMHYRLIDMVHKALSGKSLTNTNSLSRSQVVPDSASTDIYIHLATYRTRFTDESACKQYVKVTPKITPTTNLNTAP